MQHLNDLVKLISDVLQTQPTEHWVQAFERAGVPAGPVKNIKEALDDPHTRVRDLVIKVDHPVAGEIDALGLPIKFSTGNGITRRGGRTSIRSGKGVAVHVENGGRRILQKKKTRKKGTHQ